MRSASTCRRNGHAARRHLADLAARRRASVFPTHSRLIPALWANLGKTLAAQEEVHINVFSPEHELGIREALKHRAEAPVDTRIHLHPFPAYEPWCRDHGPIFVRRETEGGLAVVDWRYNAWGGKYPPCDLDDDVPQSCGEAAGPAAFFAADDSGGRFDRGEWRRHAADDRGLPAQSRTAIPN